jgi:hypothetical protein
MPDDASRPYGRHRPTDDDTAGDRAADVHAVS